MKSGLIKSIALSIGLYLISIGSAHSNLITNGDFENDGQFWSGYNAAWGTASPGNSSSNSLGLFAAYFDTTIMQTFVTEGGQTYVLSLTYNFLVNGSFTVNIFDGTDTSGDSLLSSEISSDNDVNQWLTDAAYFMAQSGNTTIEILSSFELLDIGQDPTFQYVLIDDISVVEASAPSMMLLGVLPALLLLRIKRRKSSR
jgi:hypothetical protein